MVSVISLSLSSLSLSKKEILKRVKQKKELTSAKMLKKALLPTEVLV